MEYTHTQRNLTNEQVLQLWQQLKDDLCSYVQQRACQQVVLALSGGLDSMVLLELISQLQKQSPLLCQWQVVHVHHQLQTAADAWALFCQQQCQLRDIGCDVVYVQLANPSANIEKQARDLRYQALADRSQRGSLVLTAHHADDQLESILLALKRGAGLTGLAGIATERPLGEGLLYRPLLRFSKAQLQALADYWQLEYVEDPSNLNCEFDRNFIRQQVLPLLYQRFPQFGQTASRSAVLLQQSLLFQQQQLDITLDVICDDGLLDLSLLRERPNAEHDLLLRRYLAGFAMNPTSSQLATIKSMFCHSRTDAMPSFIQDGMILRRYLDKLHVEPLPAESVKSISDSAMVVRPLEPFLIAVLDLHCCWTIAPLPNCMAIPLGITLDEPLQLEFGQLNRLFKPAEAAQHKAIKDWCKRWKVPPWRRGSMPLFIAGQQKQIVAVLELSRAPNHLFAVSHVNDDGALSYLNYWPAQSGT